MNTEIRLQIEMDSVKERKGNTREGKESSELSSRVFRESFFEL